MSNEVLDLLACGFAQSFGSTEVYGVSFDEVGIELMVAYQLAKDWDVETTARMCKEGRMESFEFFAHPEYKQKVSLEMPAADAKKEQPVDSA